MGSVMWWSIVAIGLLVAGFVAVAQIKKRMIQDEDLSGSGFSLGDLRTLHRQGKMTDAEFESAKQALVESMKKAAERRAQEQAARAAGRERGSKIR
jgi:hypothetical protein